MKYEVLTIASLRSQRFLECASLSSSPRFLVARCAPTRQPADKSTRSQLLMRVAFERYSLKILCRSATEPLAYRLVSRNDGKQPRFMPFVVQ